MSTSDTNALQKMQVFMALDLPLIGYRVKNLFKTSPSFGQDKLGFPLAEKSAKTIEQLIIKSHERPLDVNGAIPWGMGVDKCCPPKDLKQLWIYGTPYYDQLTPSERLETAWIETARDVSMFINLEQFLPPLYMGYVNRYGRSLPAQVFEYLMVFSKEEIVHTMMFRRYMQLAGLPQFRAPAAYAKLVALLPELHPCVGILATLVVEWVAELGAIHATQGEDVDPLTRDMFKQHHFDEVRHIGFASRVVEDYFGAASDAELKRIRQLFRRLIPKILDAYRYNPEVAEHTRFKFPVAADDVDAIASIRKSHHNQQLDVMRFKDMINWFKKLELM